LAGYRPIGLAPAGTTTMQAGRTSTYADRRRAAADRLQLAEKLTTRLEAAVHRPEEAAPDGTPIDPDGVLRASVRALVPLAHRYGEVDLLVSVGPDHAWAAHLTHGADGPAVELVPGPGRPESPSSPATPSEARIAAELAAWLRTGEVPTR